VDDDGEEIAAGRVAALSEVELAELVEFFLWGAFRLIPEKVGGGELSDKEQRMLGKVWSRALLPVVEKYSDEAPWIAALVVSSEVIMKRAMLAKLSAPKAGEEVEPSK
jgi:hypothetical protein